MKRIALLLENLYDERELLYPFYRMLEEGYEVDLIGTEKDSTYKSKNGLPSVSDVASKDASADDYDAVIVPGGFSPDLMRLRKATVDFVNQMHQQNKPIAAICHGPWIMVSSCDLKGKRLTGFPSLQVDIENAGATYVDEEVVVDGNLITSRTPKDLPAFMKAILKALAS